jgi:hypothetical protein
MSLVVHALPSLQVAVFGVCVQPVAGVQPSLVQGLPSLQFAVPPGTQLPPLQLSPTVHALLSEQPPDCGV